MSKRNTTLYQIDRQGHLRFSRRMDLIKEGEKGNMGWEHPAASILIMLVCGILDFVMFRQLFSAFLYDAKEVQMLSIIAMLIGFDLAPIYMGIVLKKRQQGLNAGVITAVLLGIAFVIAFIGNIALRIAVKDMILPDLSAMKTSVFGEVTEADTTNDLALLYALFAGAMPVITSLVSFGVSFQTANPLKKRMRRLQEEQVMLEDEIVKMEALLMEYETDADHFARLLEEDEEKYRNMLEMLHEKALYYCDYVREKLKEYLGDPASSNALSKDNRERLLQMLEKYPPSEEVI